MKKLVTLALMLAFATGAVVTVGCEPAKTEKKDGGTPAPAPATEKGDEKKAE